MVSCGSLSGPCWERSDMDSRIIEDALGYVKELFAGDYSGHDFFHTLRVYRIATVIAEREGADVWTVQLAALLHDVDDAKLSPETHAEKERAVHFLSGRGVPQETIAAICDMIDAVSFAGTDTVTPPTLEGRCVQDADRLDAMGAIGIARAFAYGGSRGRAMYDPEIPWREAMSAEEYRNHPSTTVNHFYEKLFQLRALMNTDTARAMAEERDAYMRAYLAEFFAEWEGVR